MSVLGCVSSLFVLPFVCWDVYVVDPRGRADSSVLIVRTLTVANVSSWLRIFLVCSSVCVLGTFMLLTPEAELILLSLLFVH